MIILDLIDQWINEHGSSAILRERLHLLKDHICFLQTKVTALEAQLADFEKKRVNYEVQIHDLEEKYDSATQEIRRLEKLQVVTLQVRKGNPHGFVCDHCGSPELKRTGNRPDPTFGDLGAKQQLFRCDDCGEQSAFLPAGKII